MIASFYNKDFVGIADNSALIISNGTYNLVKRPVEMNTLTCTCEAFNEDIQPVFLIIEDDRGRYVYGSLAGLPILNNKNQTEINGTDLKSLLSSDIVFQPSTSYNSVNEYLRDIFNTWKEQVNQGSLAVELDMLEEEIPFVDSGIFEGSGKGMIPSTEKVVINAYDEMANYLKAYYLYLDTRIDLVNKKIIFKIGKTMADDNLFPIRLWEYDVKNYGKWIAVINEAQGYYHNENTGEWQAGIKWILLSDNKVTVTKSNRDIFPIKRAVVVSTESMRAADEDSLTTLLDSLYNENIEIPANDDLRKQASLSSKFAVYLRRGNHGYKYKDLPCGELHYDAHGLTKIQIGYRYSGLDFI